MLCMCAFCMRARVIDFYKKNRTSSSYFSYHSRSQTLSVYEYLLLLVIDNWICIDNFTKSISQKTKIVKLHQILLNMLEFLLIAILSSVTKSTLIDFILKSLFLYGTHSIISFFRVWFTTKQLDNEFYERRIVQENVSSIFEWYLF